MIGYLYPCIAGIGLRQNNNIPYIVNNIQIFFLGHPLWLAITVCAINITAGLFHNASTVALFQPFRHWDCINKYFEGSNEGSTKVPAIVGILACDLLLILSAMLAKKTVDQSKKSVERRGRRTHIVFVTTTLVSFKF